MSSDTGRAFTWGCFAMLGAIFALVAIPVAMWFLCCGGVGLIGLSSSNREYNPDWGFGASTAPHSTSPAPKSDSRRNREPEPAATLTSESYFDRNLNRNESVAFFELVKLEPGLEGPNHEGRAIGFTGIADKPTEYLPGKGAFVTLKIRDRTASSKQFLVVASFVEEHKGEVLALSPGEEVSVTGRIGNIASTRDFIAATLHKCRVLSRASASARPGTNWFQMLLADARDHAEQARIAREAESRRRAEEAAAAERAQRQAEEKAKLDEQDAATLLRLAKADPNAVTRIKSLRSIIDKYPNTNAAAEAKRLLK